MTAVSNRACFIDPPNVALRRRSFRVLYRPGGRNANISDEMHRQRVFAKRPNHPDNKNDRQNYEQPKGCAKNVSPGDMSSVASLIIRGPDPQPLSLILP